MTLFLDPRFLLELAMLSVLLGVGTYVSWTDVKERRVPNASLGVLGAGELIAEHPSARVLIVGIGCATTSARSWPEPG